MAPFSNAHPTIPFQNQQPTTYSLIRMPEPLSIADLVLAVIGVIQGGRNVKQIGSTLEVGIL